MKDIFEKFGFYLKMNEADKKLLRDTALKKELDKGQIMTGDNTRCNGVPMVAKGSLRLFRISEKGREVTLYRISEGEVCLLASICAMGDVEYDFSIEAERESTLYILSPEIFKELFARSEAFKTFVFNSLAQKLIMSMETIEMLIFISIEERILEYIKQNANEKGEIRTTHEKMAIDLGSSREVISRQLKKMAEKNVLKLERGKVILPKKP
jgi:CRP/FNR family transcriptional regulator